ncbi:phospholipid transporting ATPase [Sorochytrium milnesiophthora]
MVKPQLQRLKDKWSLLSSGRSSPLAAAAAYPSDSQVAPASRMVYANISPAMSSNSAAAAAAAAAASTSTSVSASDLAPVYYPSNAIRTSKYTPWSFLPRNLFEQFSKVANLFFLLIIVLQTFPSIRTTQWYLAAMPVLVIVGVTAVKDALEDWRRHKADDAVNATLALTLDRWRNVNDVPRPRLRERILNRVGLAWLLAKRPSPPTNVFTSQSRSQTPFPPSMPPSAGHTRQQVPPDYGYSSNAPAAGAVRRESMPPEYPMHELPPVDQQQQQQQQQRSPPRRPSFTLTCVPTAAWAKNTWGSVRVGDFVLLQDGDAVPADMVLLSASEKNNSCYVETKSLDGETNLKLRYGVPELSHLETAHECEMAQFVVEAELPNVNLYTFRGNLLMKPGDVQALAPGSNNQAPFNRDEMVAMPLGPDNLLLRGCIIRNTQWAIGIAIYTGEQTKIVLNSGATPTKRSRIDRNMNRHIIYNFVMLFSMCLVCAVSTYWFSTSAAISRLEGPAAARRKNSRLEEAVLTFFVCIPLFQNIVPISLYISIEIVKVWQSWFIHADADLVDPRTGQPCHVKTWNIADDLGQIEYLFSDKTGTLTQNLMEFRRCAIGGVTYGMPTLSSSPEVSDTATLNRNLDTAAQEMHAALAHYRVHNPYGDPLPSFADALLVHHLHGPENGSGDKMASTDDEVTPTSAQSTQSMMHPLAVQRRLINEFFTLLATCHTVLADIDQPVPLTGPPGTPSLYSHHNHSATSHRSLARDGHLLHVDIPSPSIDMSGANAHSSTAHLTSETQLHKRAFSVTSLVPTASLNRASLLGAEELSSVAVATPSLAHLDEESDVSVANLKRQSVVTAASIRITYKAQSPDEAALVSAARDAGFAFLERQDSDVVVAIFGRPVRFRLLHVIEFNSTRKRMTVVLRRLSGGSHPAQPVSSSSTGPTSSSSAATAVAPDPADGEVVVYCKGADSVIMERLAKGQSDMVSKTLEQLEDFANDGYRTLCLGFRVLSEQQYSEFAKQYHLASTAMTDRDAKLDAAAELVEQELVLLGATAIEDKLQDGVPETIETMMTAGIKVWVLTGDKVETAINIGFSCNLLKRDMTLLIVKGHSIDTLRTQLSQLLKEMRRSKSARSLRRLAGSGNNNNHDADEPSDRAFALVIDGDSLRWALDERCRTLFLDLCINCRSVLCCRVSPLQKAQVVAMVRRTLNVMTLAIGDGANDVSMIQEADVGVGIAGEEGLQAALASDYAVGQFRFLTKLILVHGRWSYLRIANMVLNFFYKNMTWVFVMFVYQWFTQFSGDLMHDYTFLMFFNMIYTFLPIIVLGIFDQDVPQSVALQYPELHKSILRQPRYTSRLFWQYALNAMFQALVCFFSVAPSFLIPAHPSGLSASKSDMTATAAVTVVVVVNLFVGFNLWSWTVVSVFGIFFSAFSLFAYIPLYSLFSTSALHMFANLLYQERVFYLSILLGAAVCLLPYYVAMYIRATCQPTDANIIREREALGMPTIERAREPTTCDSDTSQRHRQEQDQQSPSLSSLKLRPQSPKGPRPLSMDASHLRPAGECIHCGKRHQDGGAGVCPAGVIAPTPTTARSGATVTRSHSAKLDRRRVVRNNSIVYEAASRSAHINTGFAFSQEHGMSDSVSAVDTSTTPRLAHSRRSSTNWIASSTPNLASPSSPSTATILHHQNPRLVIQIPRRSFTNPLAPSPTPRSGRFRHPTLDTLPESIREPADVGRLRSAPVSATTSRSPVAYLSQEARRYSHHHGHSTASTESYTVPLHAPTSPRDAPPGYPASPTYPSDNSSTQPASSIPISASLLPASPAPDSSAATATVPFPWQRVLERRSSIGSSPQLHDAEDSVPLSNSPDDASPLASAVAATSTASTSRDGNKEKTE